VGDVYAFDTTERVAIGKRSREWTAVGQTEVECVREMARCLRILAEGGNAHVDDPVYTLERRMLSVLLLTTNVDCASSTKP